MTTNHCFHADESYRERNAYGDAPAVIRVDRDQPGYTVYATTMTQEEANAMAAAKNAELGLTPEEILDIRASSMRASHIGEETQSSTYLYNATTGDYISLRDDAVAIVEVPSDVEAGEYLAEIDVNDVPLVEDVAKFAFTVTTAEGATFTPWTDGYAIGYKVTAPDLPDRYLFFNPSSDTGEDIFHTNAFVYLEADPSDQVNTHHHYDIWDHSDVEPDEDDLAWARDDLGPEATDDEVYHLANERATARLQEPRTA